MIQPLSSLHDDCTTFRDDLWDIEVGSIDNITASPSGGLKLSGGGTANGTALISWDTYEFDSFEIAMTDLVPDSAGGQSAWFSIADYDSDSGSSFTLSIEGDDNGGVIVWCNIETDNLGSIDFGFPYDSELLHWRVEYRPIPGVFDLYRSAGVPGTSWGIPLASYQTPWSGAVYAEIGSPTGDGTMTLSSINQNKIRSDRTMIGAAPGMGVPIGWTHVIDDAYESHSRFTNREFSYPSADDTAYWAANQQLSGSLNPEVLPPLHPLD